MSGTVVGANDSTRAISSRQRPALTREWVTIDAGDRVVDGRGGVGEAPDKLGGRSRVVVGALGQTEGVALAGEWLRVAASIAGELHLA